VVSAVAASIAQARSVKRDLTERLRDAAEVNGVGLTRDAEGWAVKVNLERSAPHLALPRSIDGVPVHIDIVGPIRAQ
jgi:hypothetical protein